MCAFMVWNVGYVAGLLLLVPLSGLGMRRRKQCFVRVGRGGGLPWEAEGSCCEGWWEERDEDREGGEGRER